MSFLEIIVAVVTILLGGFAIWKKILLPIYRTHLAVMETVTIVKTELKPNGGLSIKDAINRLEISTIKSEARFRNFVELSTPPHIGFFEMDNNGYLTWVCKNYRLVTNKTSEELLGASWLSTILPTERDRVYQEWKQLVENGAGGVLTFNGIVEKDKQFHFVMKLTPVLAKTQIVGFVGNLEIKEIKINEHQR